MLRRQFLIAAGAAPFLMGEAKLSPKERVDHALAGGDVDRPPFSFWHHFMLNDPVAHANRTLQFHSLYRTDIVKVMSDFPYPKPAGNWWELKVEENPFPQQIRALELIRDGLGGSKYFIETIFNPMNVAEKLSSKEELKRLRTKNPTALLEALDVITQSEINHGKRALALGAAGFLVSVANAKADELSVADYQKFSAPFDRRILEGLSGARMNILHLHVERPYLELFHDFPAPVINYSRDVSKIPIADVRRSYSQAIMGGLDEVRYRSLSARQLEAQWHSAAGEAGKKFILSPGCSVPNDSKKDELMRLPDLLRA